jgi:glucokinase
VTTAVGLDVGGTKIAGCRLEPDSLTVEEFTTVPTRPWRDGLEVLADCAAIARRLAVGSSPLGIGVCELVSLQGEITSSFTLPWVGVDLAAAFEPMRLTTVESDARAAGCAEWAAWNASVSSMLFVTVGTGLACTLIDDRGPWLGEHGNAMVLGGVALEDQASGRGLTELLGGVDLRSILSAPSLPPQVVQGARELGLTIGVLVNALDPGVVVIGGGLGRNERFRGLVEQAIRERIYSPVTRAVGIYPSKLGVQGGAIGAALLAHQRSRGSHAH